MDTQLTDLDATGQAELVRSGAVSPRELVEAAIARIERVNPSISAVVVQLYDHARLSADRVRGGPLVGVPFALKDVASCYAGMPQYFGNRRLREIDWRAPADSPLAIRFREAGLITIGKTNTPEFASGLATESAAFGATHNPWRLGWSPAGSSGGSAAAVASRMVAVAHAGDAGGSIRMPAAWCGVVGLKPSRGRVPNDVAEVNRYGVEFALTRSIRDAATLLQAVRGRVPGALFPEPSGPADCVGLLDRPGPRVRVGVLDETGDLEVPVDPVCADLAREALAVLKDFNHEVVDVGRAPFEVETNLDVIVAATVLRQVDALAEMLGRSVTSDDVEPLTWADAERARRYSAVDLLAAMSAHQAYASRLAAWFEARVDVLVTPTMPSPPLPIREVKPDGDDPLTLRRRFRSLNVFARPFNLTGQPAISIPLGQTTDGLPLGVQLVAAHGRDDLLLLLARELEVARPWHDRAPALP